LGFRAWEQDAQAQGRIGSCGLEGIVSLKQEEKMMDLVRFERNFLKNCVFFTIITVESATSAFF
jgi:hypothetical protein